MTILGIDPGSRGGLALLSEENGIMLEPMPLNPDKSVDAQKIIGVLSGEDIRAAYIEKIFALPKSGAASMLTFGKSYGVVMGVLHSLGLNVFEVRSQDWMKAIHHNPYGGTTKQRSLDTFKRMFPKVSATTPGGRAIHMGMVEACLIAEYGRRLENAR